MARRKTRRKPYLLILCCFALFFAATFFGVQFLTKTGIFRVPGVVYYDESLSSEEVALLQSIFNDEVELDNDVKISAYDTLELPDLNEGEFLYNIIVPVTDFYSSDDNILADSVEDVFEEENYDLISIDNLDFTRKLLKINDGYYLDDFKSGAVFRIVKFESDGYDTEVKPLVAGEFTKDFPSNDMTLTFAQTGVTALSRGMNEKLYKVGDANYFAEKIKDFLSSFDITHTSNESSFTDYASSKNICSDKRFISTLTAIGLDIVELTGNHNQDCGDTAALETIDAYNENNIKIVGGGKTADEAATPLEIDEKGTNITMLAYNLSTGGATYDDTPGANQYYEDKAAAQIAEAKGRGDFVIVDIQYYECSAYVSETEDTTCDYADSAAGDQVGFFRHLVDLGADVVVGTSAHQPQTFELYGDGAIYYGLGNLFFDQVWWPGTTRSLVLVHHFYKGRLLQTQIVPTVYDKNMQPEVMDAESARRFLDRLISERPEPKIAANGFQSAVENWVGSVNGEKGVVIYDLDNDKLVGSYHGNEKFATASIYKLFVVYEGYKRVQSGEWKADDIAGSTGHTVLECLDLAVRESNSACAETLWGMIGRDNLDSIAQNNFKIKSAKVSDLEATPMEIMQMMKIFYKHKEIKDSDLIARMQDSFLIQPITEYNWRQGLPSGFSDDVKVYNKVGWDWNGKAWNIYNDAAIVDFTKQNRHLIVVVMTSGVTYQQIRTLATEIEKVVNN